MLSRRARRGTSGMDVGRGAHGNWPTAATGRRPERSHVSGEVPPRALRFRPGEAPGRALSPCARRYNLSVCDREKDMTMHVTMTRLLGGTGKYRC